MNPLRGATLSDRSLRDVHAEGEDARVGASLLASLGSSSPDSTVTLLTRVVLLGVGNVLLTDEGIGVRVIDEIEARFDLPPEVRVIDGGTSAMELLDDLAGADHLIIVDAVRTGEEPGTLVRLAGADVPRFFTTKISPHQVGLSDVLATLALMDESPGETVILGVVPASLAMAMELSPTVEAVVPVAVDAVVHELERLGIRPVSRAAD